MAATTREERNEQMRLLRRTRREQKKCVNCGADDLKAGCTSCVKCLTRQATARNKCRTRRSEAGLCRRCTRPAEEGTTLCSYHLDKKWERSKTKSGNPMDYRGIMWQARQLGLCITCRTEKAEPNRLRCEGCLQKHRERRFDHRARGNCSCGRKPLPGETVCLGCRERSRRASRGQRLKRKALGLCVCGNDPRPGKKTCQKCGDRSNRSHARRASKKAKAS